MSKTTMPGKLKLELNERSFYVYSLDSDGEIKINSDETNWLNRSESLQLAQHLITQFGFTEEELRNE